MRRHRGGEEVSTAAITIVRRIGTIERLALYRGWTPAKAKAVSRMWRMFSDAVR